MMNFEQEVEFAREIKRLHKKYRSIYEDLEVFKKVLSIFPKGKDKHFACLREVDSLSIFKARFFCRYLKNESLRIIYVYDSKKGIISFLEIYFKGEKEIENKERIEKFIGSK